MNSIIIADDHPITAKGMEVELVNLGYDVIGVFYHGIRAFNQIIYQNPDYILIDMEMPGMTGLDILQEIRAKNLPIKVIIYTMHVQLSLFEQAKSLGVNGYLLKDFALDELSECMVKLEDGNFWYSPKLEEALDKKNNQFDLDLYQQLTARERTILNLIAENNSNKEISSQLFLSIKTIENERFKITEKLNLPHRRNELLRWAINNKEFYSLLD